MQGVVGTDVPQSLSDAASVPADRLGQRSSSNSGRNLFIVCAITGAVWVVLFVFRVQAHQANVDDYLYASLARQLSVIADLPSRFLTTGQDAPLVPSLATPGVAVAGLYGAMAVELPIALLLAAGSFLLARTWLAPRAAAVTALVVSLNHAALGYSMMLNFSLASTTAVIWTFATYLRSARLRDWRWSLAFGVSFSALLLSRTVAPLYAVPLAIVVVADLSIDRFKRKTPLRRTMWLPLAGTLVLAGPWWLASGHTALHYLVNAGYQPTSGYTSRGLDLTVTAIVQRAKWEMAYLGWGQSAFLALGAIAAVYLVFRYRRLFHLDGLWLLGLWAVLTYLILSTSANQGTAFGLPIIAILLVLCATVLGQAPRPWRLSAVLVSTPVLALGCVVIATSSTNNWWPGPPYRLDVLLVGGTPRTNTDLLNQQVATAVGRSTVLMSRIDALLNPNGLRWVLGSSSDAGPLEQQIITPSSWSSASAGVHALSKATVWISGEAAFPYHPLTEQPEIEAAAIREGFEPERVWTISPSNDVVLWRRGGRSTIADRLDHLVTYVAKPAQGSVISGRVLLAASARSVLGISKVTYEISSPELSHSVQIPSTGTPYGWLAHWNTMAEPVGTYSITSVATGPLGGSARSSPVNVMVRHPTAGG